MSLSRPVYRSNHHKWSVQKRGEITIRYLSQSTFVAGCGMRTSIVRLPGWRSTFMSLGHSIRGHGYTMNDGRDRWGTKIEMKE